MLLFWRMSIVIFMYIRSHACTYTFYICIHIYACIYLNIYSYTYTFIQFVVFCGKNIIFTNMQNIRDMFAFTTFPYNDYMHSIPLCTCTIIISQFLWRCTFRSFLSSSSQIVPYWSCSFMEIQTFKYSHKYLCRINFKK